MRSTQPIVPVFRLAAVRVCGGRLFVGHLAGERYWDVRSTCSVLGLSFCEAEAWLIEHRKWDHVVYQRWLRVEGDRQCFYGLLEPFYTEWIRRLDTHCLSMPVRDALEHLRSVLPDVLNDPDHIPSRYDYTRIDSF